ncbi:oligosaccharide flippase family protein [Bacteroides reticulotermitis]|nr:oligosaccharide flippase family protein [Bacteroides reticulotermitis]
MTVSVFTSRVILDVLGVEDFGIYNIVGGFVAMFSLLSGTLTAASQRFMSYELGRAKSDISKVFSTSLSIHLMLAALIFILLESAGVWFLNYKMNIAPDRLVAANWVFQCSILTFCVNLISIPYNASIIAYEKMTIFAYISVFEAVAKLGIVYLLLLFNFDKLILYAFLTLLVAIVLRCVYGFYCKYKFRECRFYFIKDKELYREMLGFSGWNFIGSSANVLNSHGINILINIFFGVALNAARGIAEQINTTLNSFVLNFMMALNPQITKNFASGDYDNMNVLIIKGAKYSFFLFWLLSLPILLETDIVLKIWLVQVPEYTSILVRYALIYTMCQILSQTLYAAMLATGKIKEYQIIVGTLSLMAFPTAIYSFF